MTDLEEHMTKKSAERELLEAQSLITEAQHVADALYIRLVGDYLSGKGLPTDPKYYFNLSLICHQAAREHARARRGMMGFNTSPPPMPPKDEDA